MLAARLVADAVFEVDWIGLLLESSSRSVRCLLAALAEIRADVVIDTYDETDEIGEPAL